MVSNIISREACQTEVTSNPKSFFNCPDMHGGSQGANFTAAVGEGENMSPTRESRRCEAIHIQGTFWMN